MTARLRRYDAVVHGALDDLVHRLVGRLVGRVEPQTDAWRRLPKPRVELHDRVEVFSVSDLVASEFTARDDFGRWPGSFCRQRRIARSTAGSRSSTSVEGCVGAESSCERMTSWSEPLLWTCWPVNTSWRINPSE